MSQTGANTFERYANALIRRLPKEEAELHEKREELSLLRRRVAAMKDDLAERRDQFAAFMENAKDSVVEKAPQIQRVFEEFGREFLVEACSLVWLPRSDRVGETGILIEFPAFEIDMASSTFPSPVRRTGPEQVSESQREFIDLSFRMALMAAADPDSGGTLIVDAPESSLDAVFVRRAADVLGKFASPARDNRLIVTSNLTDGNLIPLLLAPFESDWDRRGTSHSRRCADCPR